MERPEVSVLMAVYNGRPYLETSVRSILNQTFEDFEFIVINDGSTDGSGEVLEQFAVSDKRIRVFHQENRGIVSSLNRGLEEAKGEYVARMDADDISLPKRLECQVHFLDSNPEIGIVGTQHVWIGRDGEVTHRPTLPTNSSFISWRLLFETCIVHPSILARRSLIQRLDGYADWAKYGEDYELWTRAVLEAKLANVSQTLLKYRRWEGGQLTKTKQERIKKTVCRAAVTYHRAVLGASADKEIACFLAKMSRYGLENAVQETGVTDYASVFEYIGTLYRAHRSHFSVKQSNIRIRQAALAKLDRMADKIVEEEGRLAGLEHKLRARLMSPAYEVVPWIWKALQRRIS